MSDPAETRILVTGGTGFIGRYVVDLLRKDGLRPLITTFKELARVYPSVDTVQVDLTDAPKTNQLIRSYDPQIVLHLAGVTPGHYDPRSDIYSKVNFIATANLLRALDENGVERVIILGSAAEYGDQALPFREDMPARPVSPYANSKAQATQFALEMHAANGFPVTVLRVFTAYGWDQPEKMFFPQVIKHALLNHHFKMSDGVQKRDFVHVEDVGVAVMATLTAENAVGRIINIAGGKGIALRDLAQHIWRICGADQDRLEIGSREKTGDDSFDTEADISLAAQILNWRPRPALLSDTEGSPALKEIVCRMRSDANE